MTALEKNPEDYMNQKGIPVLNRMMMLTTNRVTGKQEKLEGKIKSQLEDLNSKII